MIVADSLTEMTRCLTLHSDSSRLDAELLLSAVLQRNRAGVLSRLDQTLTASQQNQLNSLMIRRVQGEPMAYLLGYQEFWGLELTVSPAVLIPRPETEHLVEWILTHFTADQTLAVADLGTGSGAIVLALAHERKQWQLDAVDASAAALKLAQQNAVTHRLHHVSFHQGNWCTGLPRRRYDLIVANPPYIAAGDRHLSQLGYEPLMALCAGSDGLAAIREIIAQAPDYLTESGYIVLEHGFDQAAAVQDLLQQKGFSDIQSHRDLANHPRFVTARTPTVVVPRLVRGIQWK